MKTASFDFAPTLLPLLKRNLREQRVEIRFNGLQTTKHLIESMGVPHTEIGPLKANGKPIEMDYQVQNSDRIQVWPVEPISNGPIAPRFVLDGHLGRLASYLRMLGFDCLYRGLYEDEELAQVSVEEARILLTRDRMLLMRKVITQGYLLRSLSPEEQLKEIMQRYSLSSWVKPFKRCIRCNHALESVKKDLILKRLEPLTKKYFDEFSLCPGCDQIYWKGSHFDHMQKIIEELCRNKYVMESER